MVKGNVSVSGGISSEVVGDFLAHARVTEERAVELYNLYLKCIRGQSSFDEEISIVEARYLKTNRFLKEYGLKNLSLDLENYYKQYSKALRSGQIVLASEASYSFQEAYKKAQDKIREIETKKNNDNNEFLFTSLNLTLKKAVILFDGKITITALDKRNKYKNQRGQTRLILIT